MRHAPNLLSVLRLGLAVVFPWVPPVWRLPAVVAAGATDWLDGFLARRYGAQSVFGGILDAVADKAFVLSVLLTLAIGSEIEAWRVPLLLIRDFAVAYVSGWYALRRRWAAFHNMPARWTGKVTTVLLFVWFLLLLSGAPDLVRTIVFWASVVASIVAAVDYLGYFARVRASGVA